MTTSIVECLHCHYRFNYEFIPGASFHSIRLGPKRLFKCPNCKDIHTFTIDHFGTDPSLPTFGDNSQTGIGGRTWAMLLGPVVALVALGYLLEFTVGFRYPSFLITPIALAIVWIVVYTVYLARKTGGSMNNQITETN